jgi:catechol 2,3-dioxygenase-like lactoylglutathione lyase family enzyme
MEGRLLVGSITGADWLIVPVEQFDETVSFLRDVLGLNLVDQGVPVTDPHFTRYARFELPGPFTVELVEPTEASRATFRQPVLCIAVDDLTAAAAELRAKNVDLVSEVIRAADGQAWVYVREPGGTVLQFYGPS